MQKLGNYGPQDAINFARAFPNKKFIMGHLLRASVKALEMAKQMDNVVIETSGISGHLRWFENNQRMADKIVFGSSYPFSCWWDYKLIDEINIINALNIKDEIKNKILYENIRNFLNL